jgi:hypothetical protein
MQLSAQFSTIASRQKIDAVGGILHGVSVITEGEASGHGLLVDATTLQQIKETASAYTGGLKVKVNHGKNLESIVGVLKNFVVDGKQLRADLHLLKTAEDRAKIIEMAETMPESFGLSVSIANEPEEIEGKKFIRCAEIYSADLVDGPAANPGGLFSKPNEQIKTENMSKALALSLSLPETATDEEIALALKKERDAFKTALEAIKPTDLSAVTTELSAVKNTLTELAQARDNALNLAKKAEIDALMAEASRDGKVVPFESDDLYTVKDGVINILQQPAQLSKVISKLAKGTVALTRKTVTAPKDGKGNELTLAAFRNSEGNLDRSKLSSLAQFCAERRAAGAVEIDASLKQN